MGQHGESNAPAPGVDGRKPLPLHVIRSALAQVVDSQDVLVDPFHMVRDLSGFKHGTDTM
jgi:hypothetical protein